MKLNKWTKESIVAAIMQDVPKSPDNVIRTEMQAALISAMSAPVLKLYKTHPTALKVAHVSGWETELGYSVDLIAGDADVQKSMAPFVARKKARADARHKLQAAVMGCSTLAQLKKLLPEFEAYFPTEEQPTKNLPALANMVADLSKLGWPKDKTKEKTNA